MDLQGKNWGRGGGGRNGLI